MINIDYILIQLSNCSLFNQIQPNRIKELLQKYPYNSQNYVKGQLILSKGENWDELKIVIQGVVSAVMNDDLGKTLKVDDLRTGQSLAPAFLFSKSKSYPVDVYAKTDCILLCIPKPILLQLFNEEQKILENYLSMVSNIVQMLTKKLRILTLKTLKAKIAFALVNEVKMQNSNRILFGRQEFADFLGAERPSISRVLGQMQKDGLIKIDGKAIEIINLPNLKSLLP